MIFGKPAQETLNKKLHKAIGKGHIEDVKKLIKEGADVNAGDKYGALPIISAINYRRLDIVHALMEAGADINKATSSGNTALMSAARMGYVEICAALIGVKADVQAANSRGETALHQAAANGKMQAVTMLVNAGAPLEARNAYGSTAANVAATHYPGIVQYLEGEIERREKKDFRRGQDIWRRESEHEVMHISDRTGYRITEIFNFSVNTHLHIVRNLATNAESHILRHFSDCTDMTGVVRAAAKLEEMGGKIGEEAARRLSPKVKTLLPEYKSA